jgi:hypothetical protein
MTTPAEAFAFLPPGEIPVAVSSFSMVGGILAGAPLLPRAALFDMDGTLCNERTQVPDGRMIGALYAFRACGVLAGIYSLRPHAAIIQFLEQNPLVAMQMAEDEGGSLWFLDNDHVNRHMEQVCAGMDNVKIGRRRIQSRVDSASFLSVPFLLVGGVEEWFDALKFVPYADTLLIDDKDYGRSYLSIVGALEASGHTGSALYAYARHSLTHLWHVDAARKETPISEHELEDLRRLVSLP